MPLIRGNINVVRNDYSMNLKNPIIVEDKIYIDEKTFIPNNQDSYILVFTDGKNTLPIFKKLYSNGNYKEIYIKVTNFEYFYKVFSDFKDISSLNYLENIQPSIKNESLRIKKYALVELKIRKKNNDADNKIQKLSREAYKISFEPDIISSITSSLINPQIYLSSPELSCSKIYNLLRDGPKTLKQLKSAKIPCLEENLKSLCVFKAIYKRSRKFHVNKLVDLS